MKNQLLGILIVLGAVFNTNAQRPAHLVRPSDSLNTDAFINTVEQSLRLFYADYVGQKNYD